MLQELPYREVPVIHRGHFRLFFAWAMLCHRGTRCYGTYVRHWTAPR